MSKSETNKITVIGAGIGGLTTAALLAKAGYAVTVMESQSYPGGCASTFFHKGYRFESGATLAGGFQPNGPHALVGEMLDLQWDVVQHDPAWVVHLPDRSIKLCQDGSDVLRHFPETESFWHEQQKIADLAWKMAAEGLPWTPTDVAEVIQLAKVGIRNFPQDLRVIPFTFRSVYDWLRNKGLHENKAFVRFLDASLLISAQTTSQYANALYGATAIDLPRQGVYHVEGGIGGIAETLVKKLQALGGEILYRQNVTRIQVENGRVKGVYAKKGQRTKQEDFFPCDYVIANLTPWSLRKLLGEASPPSLIRETQNRKTTFGAFVLHLGVKADSLPPHIEDHHQIIADYESPLGEGTSSFLSMSPTWDHSRAPEGFRAVTITTHTNFQQWWELFQEDKSAYYARKDEYTERIVDATNQVISGFRAAIDSLMAGTPLTYEFYTRRHQGMVGGFPQTSLFNARNPRTGITNLRLVGDSIFPGQSTAGVSLGAVRVANDVQRNSPLP